MDLYVTLTVAPRPVVTPVSKSGGTPSLSHSTRVPVERVSPAARLSQSTSALPSPLKSPINAAESPPTGPPKFETVVKVPSPLPSQSIGDIPLYPRPIILLYAFQRMSAIPSPLKSAIFG